MKITVDHERCLIKIGRESLRLPPKAFDILSLLVEADGKVLSRNTLFDKIWGSDQVGMDTRTLDQHICRLRRRHKAFDRSIVTVPYRGYCVEQ